MKAAADAVRGPVRAAAFAAVVAALGLLPPIPVPVIPVPITAQTLGVMLAGLVLGPRGGAQAMLLFLALVALGFPLLAGGRGGLGVFAGPSAGFLIAFPLAAAATGFAARRFASPYAVWRGALCALGGGVIALYALGVPWMAAVAKLSLPQAALASAAFLPGDVLKAVLAAMVAGPVRRGYPALAP
jgi:biotin transport system substrate-specific component